MLKNIGGVEFVLFLAVVFVVFGTNKVPELIKGIAKAIREFRKAVK